MQYLITKCSTQCTKAGRRPWLKVRLCRGCVAALLLCSALVDSVSHPACTLTRIHPSVGGLLVILKEKNNQKPQNQTKALASTLFCR